MCGVAQLGDGTRFPLETLAALTILGDILAEHFDRNGAVEPGVFGLVDLPHPASTNGCHDLVGAEPLTRRKGHGSLGAS